VHRLIVCTGILHGGATDPGLRPEKSLRQLRLANLQRCMAVNAWAPLMALEAFSPLLRHTDGAVAAALSAMVGSIGDNRLGGWYSYRMSKAALNMGLRSAAIELGRQRHAPIVVAVHPGTTLSALSAPFAGPERARPAHDSAAAILRVLDGLGPDDTGRFFNWDGRELPW
jgi:NAD(P)-dependent dehydrogenase (short-subunit alcohol dehydrogenase family)